MMEKPSSFALSSKVLGESQTYILFELLFHKLSFFHSRFFSLHTETSEKCGHNEFFHVVYEWSTDEIKVV